MTLLPDGREVIHPKTRAQLRSWLERNCERPKGVWLATFKASTGKRRLAYPEIAEELLAYGWIDGQANTLDDERSLLWISPRKPRSGWSKVNKERIARLEREGRMTDAGRKAVATAKKNGAWSSLDRVEALEVPPDLAASLAANKEARRNFDAFPPSSKKIILTWIASAKRDETRRKRIEETVRLAAVNRRANHYERR